MLLFLLVRAEESRRYLVFEVRAGERLLFFVVLAVCGVKEKLEVVGYLFPARGRFDLLVDDLGDKTELIGYLVLYTLVAAPLMLLGMPEWMGRRILARLRIYRAVSWIARPVPAALIFNALLVFTHSPWAVEVFRASEVGSFAMDVVWLLMGFLLWLPIISPLPEMTRSGPPVKMAYLFLAAGVVPAIPAGFLTFAETPLYSVYELAPRFHGLAAGTDQQIAGLVMKLGGIPIIWGTMLAICVKWLRPAEFSAGTRISGDGTVIPSSSEPDAVA